jgi:hypothetical protein
MGNIINAQLAPNLLTPVLNDYTAVVISNGSAGPADIISSIREDGIELNEATLMDVITRYNAKAAALAASGTLVNTGLVHLRTTVRGAVYDKVWNPQANPVYISATPSQLLRKAASETEVRILGIKSELIELLGITDLSTQLTDGSVTRGRVAELRGSYIRIAGDNPAVGIFFTDITTGDVYKAEQADIVVNDPSRIMVQIPEGIPDGEYTLSVVTQYSSNPGKLLKEPRSAVLALPVSIS